MSSTENETQLPSVHPLSPSSNPIPAASPEEHIAPTMSDDTKTASTVEPTSKVSELPTELNSTSNDRNTEQGDVEAQAQSIEQKPSTETDAPSADIAPGTTTTAAGPQAPSTGSRTRSSASAASTKLVAYVNPKLLPKRPTKPFLIFMKDKREFYKAKLEEEGNVNANINAVLGEAWQNMSPTEKAFYQQQYTDETEAYSARLVELGVPPTARAIFEPSPGGEDVWVTTEEVSKRYSKEKAANANAATAQAASVASGNSAGVGHTGSSGYQSSNTNQSSLQNSSFYNSTGSSITVLPPRPQLKKGRVGTGAIAMARAKRLEEGGESALSHEVPVQKVRTLVTSVPGVSSISTETASLIARAGEEFILYFTERMFTSATEKRRKTLTFDDVRRVIRSDLSLQFLRAPFLAEPSAEEIDLLPNFDMTPAEISTAQKNLSYVPPPPVAPRRAGPRSSGAGSSKRKHPGLSGEDGDSSGPGEANGYDEEMDDSSVAAETTAAPLKPRVPRGRGKQATQLGTDEQVAGASLDKTSSESTGLDSKEKATQRGPRQPKSAANRNAGTADSKMANDQDGISSTQNVSRSSNLETPDATASDVIGADGNAFQSTDANASQGDGLDKGKKTTRRPLTDEQREAMNRKKREARAAKKQLEQSAINPAHALGQVGLHQSLHPHMNHHDLQQQMFFSSLNPQFSGAPGNHLSGTHSQSHQGLAGLHNIDFSNQFHPLQLHYQQQQHAQALHQAQQQQQFFDAIQSATVPGNMNFPLFTFPQNHQAAQLSQIGSSNPGAALNAQSTLGHPAASPFNALQGGVSSFPTFINGQDPSTETLDAQPLQQTFNGQILSQSPKAGQSQQSHMNPTSSLHSAVAVAATGTATADHHGMFLGSGSGSGSGSGPASSQPTEQHGMFLGSGSSQPTADQLNTFFTHVPMNTSAPTMQHPSDTTTNNSTRLGPETLNSNPPSQMNMNGGMNSFSTNSNISYIPNDTASQPTPVGSTVSPANMMEESSMTEQIPQQQYNTQTQYQNTQHQSYQ